MKEWNKEGMKEGEEGGRGDIKFMTKENEKGLMIPLTIC